VNNPDWLSSLNLGHDKEDGDSQASGCKERYQRTRERERVMKRCTLKEMLQQTPFIITELMDLVSEEEVQQIAIEEFETAKQYIKLDRDSTRSECTCSSELKALQDKLDSSEITIQTLSQKLNENLPPFCEDSFTSDEFTMFYTGIPNINIVKSIFEHVSKGAGSQHRHEADSFPTIYLCPYETKNQCSQ